MHTRCNVSPVAKFLPTRILELDDTNAPTKCRLVRREDCTVGARYTALSYCWGSSPSATKLRLLRSTLSSFQQGIAVATFPKTFRDAVRVNACLGMQSLWIDSLCSFQDSHDDWQKEAATMRDVYRNAHLTISAASGSDNDAGLFYEREITDLVAQSFELKTAQMNPNVTYASQDARMQ